jgi:hypothetical protein
MGDTTLLVVIILVFVSCMSVLANVLITALNFKLYTEYWKDSTIKRRYEGKSGGGT